MATIIFSNQMQQPYSEWITEALQTLGERKPKAIGIVALCDEETVTGYWEADCMDKATMAQHIQADYIDELVSVNFKKYLAENGIEVDDCDDSDMTD